MKLTINRADQQLILSEMKPFYGHDQYNQNDILIVPQHYEEMCILSDHFKKVYSHNIYRSGYCRNMSMEGVITHAMLLYYT
jgi:hypothetical protein